MLATPGVASAADTVTPMCSEDCLAPHWVQTVQVQFNWTGAESTLSDDCHNGDPFTVTTEGDQTFTCTVTYADLSTATGVAHVMVDHTPPTADAGTPSLAANALGWWNALPLSVSFGWTDPVPAGANGVSGVNPDDCDTVVPYAGGDTLSTSVGSACRDRAGNLGAAGGFPVKFDNTPPDDVGGTPARAPDHSGWYTHDVTYTFHGTDSGSGIASCDSVTYSGPDSGSALVNGGCSDNAGNRTDAQEHLSYDATKPTVNGATADRAPDHGDWYNHPVSFSFHGSDATSGNTTCGTVGYSGPDDNTASVTGKCTDAAGNTASKAVPFKYDSSAPAKSKVFAVPANKAVSLSWAPPTDGESFVVKRVPAIGAQQPSTVYRGTKHDYLDTGLKNGAKYNYTVTTLDPAGNAADAAISSVPDGSTLRPFIDSEVTQPPTLTWKKVKRATYYNLQLFKGRKKVLSIWPRNAKLQLKSSWKYSGHKYNLSSGLYRWYVWPGIGRLAAHRYGQMVGSSTFRVK